MSVISAVIAALTLVSAIAAISLRHLVHCALCAALAFAGVAALFLNLGAQFVGLAQVLVYVGAVAILIVFAILLTRANEATGYFARSWWIGLLVAGAVWITVSATLVSTLVHRPSPVAKVDVSTDVAVQHIGTQLMTEFVLPLEILALLLTAAAIGAVIIAMRETGAER